MSLTNAITVEEFCKELQISRGTFEKQILKKGFLKYFRLRPKGKILIKREDVDKYIESHMVYPTAYGK